MCSETVAFLIAFASSETLAWLFPAIFFFLAKISHQEMEASSKGLIDSGTLTQVHSFEFLYYFCYYVHT